MFEVETLVNASPATVSRAGIIYVSDTDLDWAPVVEGWIAKQEPKMQTLMTALFSKYMGTSTPVDPGLCYDWITRNCKPAMNTSRVGTVNSLCDLIIGLTQGRGAIDISTDFETRMERIFLYALFWTVGGLLETSDRFKFEEFVKAIDAKFFPTVEEGDKVGVLVVTTTSKEGALVGGPSFMKAMPDDVIEGIVSDNIPIFTEQEKYNEAVLSSVKRVEAALLGKPDIAGPTRAEKAKGGNFKTREETKASRNKFAGVVIGLLVIATAVPMIQYYGYVGK